MGEIVGDAICYLLVDHFIRSRDIRDQSLELSEITPRKISAVKHKTSHY